MQSGSPVRLDQKWPKNSHVFQAKIHLLFSCFTPFPFASFAWNIQLLAFQNGHWFTLITDTTFEAQTMVACDGWWNLKNPEKKETNRRFRVLGSQKKPLRSPTDLGNGVKTAMKPQAWCFILELNSIHLIHLREKNGKTNLNLSTSQVSHRLQQACFVHLIEGLGHKTPAFPNKPMAKILLLLWQNQLKVVKEGNPCEFKIYSYSWMSEKKKCRLSDSLHPGQFLDLSQHWLDPPATWLVGLAGYMSIVPMPQNFSGRWVKQ